MGQAQIHLRPSPPSLASPRRPFTLPRVGLALYFVAVGILNPCTPGRGGARKGPGPGRGALPQPPSAPSLLFLCSAGPVIFL